MCYGHVDKGLTQTSPLSIPLSTRVDIMDLHKSTFSIDLHEI